MLKKDILQPSYSGGMGFLEEGNLLDHVVAENLEPNKYYYIKSSVLGTPFSGIEDSIAVFHWRGEPNYKVMFLLLYSKRTPVYSNFYDRGSWVGWQLIGDGLGGITEEEDPIYMADKPNIAFKTDLEGFLTAETDPVWEAEKDQYALNSALPDMTQYYTKPETDDAISTALEPYITAETDPVYEADKPNIVTNDSLVTALTPYLKTETDPLYSADKSSIAFKADVTTAIGIHNNSSTAHTDLRNLISINTTNIGNLNSGVSVIQSKIPSQASSTNQLADKAFVNSSLSSLSANRVTYDAVGNAFPTKQALTDAISSGTFYHAGASYTPTNHDYLLIESDESAPDPFTNGQTRWEFDGTQWNYAYGINNRPFTAAETAALDSGITENLVSKIGLLDNPGYQTKTNADQIGKILLGGSTPGGPFASVNIAQNLQSGLSEIPTVGSVVNALNSKQDATTSAMAGMLLTGGSTPGTFISRPIDASLSSSSEGFLNNKTITGEFNKRLTNTVVYIPVGDTRFSSYNDITEEGFYYFPDNAAPLDCPIPERTQHCLSVKSFGEEKGGFGKSLIQQIWINKGGDLSQLIVRGRGSGGNWGSWYNSQEIPIHPYTISGVNIRTYVNSMVSGQWYQVASDVTGVPYPGTTWMAQVLKYVVPSGPPITLTIVDRNSGVSYFANNGGTGLGRWYNANEIESYSDYPAGDILTPALTSDIPHNKYFILNATKTTGIPDPSTTWWWSIIRKKFNPNTGAIQNAWLTVQKLSMDGEWSRQWSSTNGWGPWVRQDSRIIGWGWVNGSNGSLVKGNGITSVQRTEAGVYQINCSANISQATIVCTASSSGIKLIMEDSTSRTANSCTIRVYNTYLVYLDSNFSFIIT